MKIGSLCTGYGGFDKPAQDLGFEISWQVEIEANCNHILRRHFPAVGRFRNIHEVGKHNLSYVDCIVGGTPCQSFSVAGNRESMNDDRGNLVFEFVRVCDEINPAYVLWENVPGVLNTKDNAFGCFIAALVGADAPLVGPYESGRWPSNGLASGPKRSLAWRITDLQYYGVPQRRRRVFLLALRDFGAERAAEILFIRKSVRWNPEKGGKAGQRVTQSLTRSLGSGGADDNRAQGGFYVPEQCTGLRARMSKGSPDPDCTETLIAFGGNNTKGPIAAAAALNACQTASGRQDFESETIIVHTLKSEGFDGSEDGTGRGTLIIPTLEAGARTGKSTDDPRAGIGVGEAGDPMYSLQRGKQHAVAFTERSRADGRNFEYQEELAYSLTNPGSGGRTHSRQLAIGMQVRRLTPKETERLMGLDDDWTAWGIDESGKRVEISDSARHRMIGNGVGLPCVEWIMRRIKDSTT